MKYLKIDNGNGQEFEIESHTPMTLRMGNPENIWLPVDITFKNPITEEQQTKFKESFKFYLYSEEDIFMLSLKEITFTDDYNFHIDLIYAELLIFKQLEFFNYLKDNNLIKLYGSGIDYWYSNFMTDNMELEFICNYNKKDNYIIIDPRKSSLDNEIFNTMRNKEDFFNFFDEIFLKFNPPETKRGYIWDVHPLCQVYLLPAADDRNLYNFDLDSNLKAVLTVPR